ncbi:MAG: ArsS family sensor histidine kinase [Halarcobacter sp.]
MSIFKKLSVLFILSLITMLIIGIWTDRINSKRLDDLIKDKYQKISNEIFQNIDNKENLNALISKYKLKKTNSIKIKNSETLYFKQLTFGYIKILKNSFEDEFIIQIEYLDDKYIFETADVENINDKIKLNALVFLDISLLILIFLYILKLLAPLKNITTQIDNFSKGNLTSRIDIKSKDEIGLLAKTFNSMADNLEELIKTREELLRDIGHELRTPIAKGKFAIEKIEDFSKKELLNKVFLDLERLTNELIQLEKLNASKLNYSNFSAETLIVQSLGKLYIEDESKIDLEIIDNFKINADLEYLSIALKNLIDNAIKYSTVLPIKIVASNNEIKVINKGNKLSKELEYYLKPFTQELIQRDGFGLGLSIVNKIIHKHNFKLLYTYKDNCNIFILQAL